MLGQELRADQDILFDGETGKAGRLRHEDNAAPHPLIGAQPRDVFAGKIDAARPQLDQPHDRFQQSRLAGAVGAEEHDRLVLVN